MLTARRVCRARVLDCAKRGYASTSTVPKLPDQEDWKKVFPYHSVDSRDRVSVSNPATAARLAEAFVPDGLKDQVVVEAFPGPGAVTRALMELPHDRIRNIIVLEDSPKYLEYLRPLEYDSRVQVVEKNGAAWPTYQYLNTEKYLDDVAAVPFADGVPDLHFVSHIPYNIAGEQLLAQFFRCIPDSSWLFTKGRLPMHLIMSSWLWQRTSAIETDAARCKVSVIADAVAQSTHSVDPDSLLPYDDHFHPVPSSGQLNDTRRTENRRKGQPMCAVTVRPRAVPLIPKGQLDKWDFVLRRLFVKKSTSLRKAISNLAPGAEDLLQRIEAMEGLDEKQRVNIGHQIRHLTVDEWATVCRAFDEWPFAPEDLMITDGFVHDLDK